MTGIPEPYPQILVLLATHNGRLWIEAQLKSLNLQSNVRIRVLINDDNSHDKTSSVIIGCLERYKIDGVVTNDVMGSASQNFFY